MFYLCESRYSNNEDVYIGDLEEYDDYCMKKGTDEMFSFWLKNLGGGN